MTNAATSSAGGEAEKWSESAKNLWEPASVIRITRVPHVEIKCFRSSKALILALGRTLSYNGARGEIL